MKHNIHQKIIFIIFPFVIFSCKKFVQIDPPPTRIQTGEIFQNDQAAISSVTGLYSKMSPGSLQLSNGATTVIACLSADDIYNAGPNANYEEFFKNTVSPDNSINSGLWRFSYANIYHVNAVLEGLGQGVSLTDSTRKQLRGEMLFIRAFSYFYLVNFYGDVPLQTSTDYEVNAVMPRSPATNVYQQILKDLLEAQNLLNTTYPSVNRARPNKWTATALLARVYLYKGEWANAEAQANSVIASGTYSLFSPLSATTDGFQISSNEIIWQLVRDNANTVEGANFIPTSATSRPTFALTTWVLNSFQANDARKKQWVDSAISAGLTYYYPKKYRQRTITVTTPPTAPSEYYVMFRLAEQYLVRAEARAQQNNLGGAIQDLNLIRTRATLPSLSSSLTQSQVLSAVEQERRTELFAEWGHRWFDLKRTNRADAVLGVLKAPNWQPTDVLYPIPQSELDLNPFLVQNPGY